MVPLLLALSILGAEGTGPGTSVVVVSRRTGVSKTQAVQWAMQTHQVVSQQLIMPFTPEGAIKSLNSVGVQDALVCKGKPRCLVELGKKLKVEAVLALSLTVVRRDLSFYLEAFSTADGRSLSSVGFITPANADLELPVRLAEFAIKVRAGLGLPPPVPHESAAPPRVVAVPVPLPADPASPLEAAAPPSLAAGAAPAAALKPEGELMVVPPAKSRVPAFAVAGLAAATAVTSAVLLTQGVVGKVEADRTTAEGWLHPYSERERLKGQSDRNYLLAGVGGVLAGGLAVTAVFLW